MFRSSTIFIKVFNKWPLLSAVMYFDMNDRWRMSFHEQKGVVLIISLWKMYYYSALLYGSEGMSTLQVYIVIPLWTNCALYRVCVLLYVRLVFAEVVLAKYIIFLWTPVKYLMAAWLIQVYTGAGRTMEPHNWTSQWQDINRTEGETANGRKWTVMNSM